MRSSRRVTIAIAVALACQSAYGTNHTWDGGYAFGPDSMNQASNWSIGGLPTSSGSNLTLIFPAGADSSTPNQNIGTPLVLQSLQQTGGFYTYTGNAYRFANLGAAPTILTSTPATFNAGLDFQASTSWTANSTVVINGILAGAGNMVATGTGQFQMGGTGPSSHTGTLTFNNINQVIFNRSGTVTLGDVSLSSTNFSTNVPNQLGTNSDAFLDNGSIWYVNANQSVRDITINNLSQISLSFGQQLTMTGNLTSTAGFSVLGGSGGTLNLGGSARIFNITGAGTNESVSVNSAVINGSVSKTGAGTLTMGSNLNSFNAQNFVSGGTLIGITDSVGSVNIGAAGKLALWGGDFNSPIVFGTGMLELSSFHLFNVAQPHAGVTNVVGGGAVIGVPANLPQNVTSTSSGMIVFQDAGSGTYTGSLSGGIAIQKVGTGTTSIGGPNTNTGQVELQQGTLRLLADGALGTGMMFLGANSSSSNIEAVGSRIVSNPLVSIGNIAFTGSGNLHFTDTGVKFANFQVVHNSTGTTTLDGKFNLGGSGTLTVNSGTLILGNPSQVGGFTSGGGIIVNGGVLTVRSFNFTTLSDVTLAGGILNAPNGYAIPLGAALQGNGGVTGRVASANGSSVIANGNLAMGDAAHVAGVNLDGELYTSQFAVSLLDANQSVLGSLTQIGTPSNLGTLNAANGVVLNFGRNITGRGTIVSGNTLATASIINGDVLGDSFANYLEFTGYVKGVGNFNNVAFSGTFAPGLSPALLTVGNVILSSSNVLDIELGGMNRGSQFDAFDITGTMKFGGELKLSYINAFSASLGNQFNIFDGATTGSFATFNFPPLANGWQWDTSLLYTQGIVQVVVPEPSMLGMISFGAIALMRRRK